MTEKKPPQYASWTHGKLPLPEDSRGALPATRERAKPVTAPSA